MLACLGLLDDAAPLFGPSQDVPGAGVLLAVPALVESGAFDIAADLHGGIGPAFNGLRTTLVTLLAPRSGSDLWRLDLRLREQNFRTDDLEAEDGPWSRAQGEPVPVTIRVRLDGQTAWTTSADYRYKGKWRKTGKTK